MTCKSRECKNKFTPEAPQQKYCTVKCQRREGYLKTMDTGWRAGIKVVTHNKTCGYRKCDKDFETRDPRRVYCCEKHSKLERLELRKESRRNSNSDSREREVACAWRGCSKSFKTKRKQVKYCCSKHRSAENRAILDSKRYPNGRVIPKDKVEHKPTKKRDSRFKIPNFSTTWMQEAWERRTV